MDRRLLIGGLGVVVLAGLAGGWWWFAKESEANPTAEALVLATSVPKTCADVVGIKGAGYSPIRVGPISFDPGSDTASGSDIRHLGKTRDGYIVKSFMAIEKFAGGQLVLTGTNVATGTALTFDYPQELEREGYRAQMVFPAAEMDRLSLRPPAGQAIPASWTMPGAWAAPELGIYELHVDDERGKHWSTTVSICRGLEFAAPRTQ